MSGYKYNDYSGHQEDPKWIAELTARGTHELTQLLAAHEAEREQIVATLNENTRVLYNVERALKRSKKRGGRDAAAERLVQDRAADLDAVIDAQISAMPPHDEQGHRYTRKETGQKLIGLVAEYEEEVAPKSFVIWHAYIFADADTHEVVSVSQYARLKLVGAGTVKKVKADINDLSFTITDSDQVRSQLLAATHQCSTELAKWATQRLKKAKQRD